MFGKFSAEIKKLYILFITKNFVIQNNEVNTINILLKTGHVSII